MKKLFLKSGISTLILSLIFALNIVLVEAASFSVSRSASSVSPGGSFTVTISASGAGKFSVSASNGSVSSSSVWVEGSASVSCKAGQSGTTTITVTAIDATGYDETPITGSKSTSVSIKSSSSSSSSSNSSSSTNHSTVTNEPKEPEVKKSSEKNLSSLSISEGTLSPKFSSSKTSYDVSLTSETESLTISAKAKDGKAKVSGTGKKALKIGLNTFEVVVTAEDGSKKSYTINVNVEEVPTSYVNMGNTQLGVLKSSIGVEVPKGFKETTVSVDGTEIRGWTNDQITIVYLMDENKNKSFYVYEDGKIVDQYRTITVLGKEYTILVIPSEMIEQDGLISGKVKINDLQIDGWSFKNEQLKNYSILYLMNDAGEKNLYMYEATEGTLQKYTPVEEENDNTLTYVFIGTTALFVVSTAVLGYMYISFKKKSISAIKDYYERKNQG